MLENILVWYMNLMFSAQNIVSDTLPLIGNNRIYIETNQFSPLPPLPFWSNLPTITSGLDQRLSSLLLSYPLLSILSSGARVILLKPK